MPVVTVSEQHAQKDDEWFDGHELVYQAEVAALGSSYPLGMGIEVGVGTGRFAVPLGVQFGLDPSRTHAPGRPKTGASKFVRLWGNRCPFTIGSST